MLVWAHGQQAFDTHKAQVAGAKEHLDKNPAHLIQRQAVSCEHGKCCKKPKVEYNNNRQKVAESLGHFLQHWNLLI